MANLFESQESSSPMITRAVAAGLTGKTFQGYKFTRFERAALSVMGHFPQQFPLWLIPRMQSSKALDPGQLNELSISDLIRGRLNDYAGMQTEFPAVVIGAGLGGAAAHISLALGAPFLPQAFVMTIKGGSVDGNVQRYFDRSYQIARQITDKNPEVMSIQHYDPIHDGWLVRSVNHLRLKLITLPEEYNRFLKSQLKKGGSIVYLDGGAQWLRYQVGERNVFQVGGWGDISAEEFLEGSDRIRAYCRKERISDADWKLAGFPLLRGPESEWGSEPGLKEAIERFCLEEGFHFVNISFSDPNAFSLFTYRAVGEQYRINGVKPQGTIIETFSQYDPAAVLKYGLIPLWLIFNTEDSLRFLRRASVMFDTALPVLFSPLATFSLTPDMAPFDEWVECLKPFRWLNIGAREGHYPADTWALVHWQERLREWGKEHLISVLPPLDPAILKAIAESISRHDL